MKDSLPYAIGFLLACLSLQAQEEPPVRALVVSDTGVRQHGIISQKMDRLGWDVGSAKAMEVLHNGASSLMGRWDVIWIPAKTNYPALRRLVEEEGPVQTFAASGGIVVVMGVTPGDVWLDVDPGGLDAIRYQGPGTATIAAMTHPMVTGQGIGGVHLTDRHFDPHSTGGNAFFLNVETGAEVIVENDAGPVVSEYRYGGGRIWIAATDRENPSCGDNLLLYLQSLY